MFMLGLTYRPGFPLNSSELSGLVHIPPTSIFECRRIEIKTLETLSVMSDELRTGCLIGTCDCAGVPQPVCIPERLRFCSVHYIGRMGSGKSTLMENNIDQDIREGSGLALLDPHGDLVEQVLRRIPAERVGRAIYFDPAGPHYVPLWNPPQCPGVEDRGRIADDLVAAIKNVVEGWGDRLENLLRYAFPGLLSVPDATLQDVADLLRRKSHEGETLRKRVLALAENESARKFWKEDFDACQKSELTPPQHKLSKLLASGTYAEMLSQPQSLIDFWQVMDEGKILLVDLSRLGSETRDILGCFILSVLHVTALSRSAIAPEQRKPFHIYCDEAHRFATDSLEDLLTEARKHKVGLTLAHQYMSQFTTRKRDALSSVGATVIFNVDTKDANHIRKDLQDKVVVSDLISLKTGEAIARIGTEIVRFKTLPPLEAPEKRFREQIIAESRRRYYRPLAELRAMKQRRAQNMLEPLARLPGFDGKEPHYDEL